MITAMALLATKTIVKSIDYSREKKICLPLKNLQLIIDRIKSYMIIKIKF